MQCKTELVGQVGLFAVLGMATICPSHSVQAQITPDTTLGAEASQVVPGVAVPGGQGTLIEGGATRGAHLFHSFSDFNVGNGQRVYFDNPAGVLNIFSRVTGNSGSNILGTLGVDGMANLYLLNPNGIVFGPNARLDVSGSFVASTANRLMFDNGQFFSAVAPNQPPLLQINVTPGLQYGNNLNATIRNQGNLQVGQNLTLGAQRLELAGSLEAGRDITLQGWSRQLSNTDYMVGGYLFTQDLTGQGIDLLIPHENVILANGDVRFTQNYVGESLHVLAGGQVSRAAGANNITITGTSGGSVTERIATGTGGLQAVTVTASDQPIVDIRSGVDWSQLTGGLPGNSNTSGAAVTFGLATGDGIALGNIRNNGGDIALWAAGSIAANNLNTSVSIVSSTGEDVQGADGGAISVSAGNKIEVGSITSYSESYSETFSINNNTLSEAISGDVVGGNGGDIALIAGQSIDAGYIGSLSFSGSRSLLYPDTSIQADTISGDVVGGSGGNISLAAGQDINVSSIDSFSDSISRSQSYIYATSGQVTGGHGGGISLVARRNINVNDRILSGSYSTSDAVAELPDFLLIPTSDNVMGGTGGTIALDAGQNISVGSIDSISFSQSRAASNAPSDSRDATGGDGGNIYLIAGQNINIDSINSSSFSSSDPNGNPDDFLSSVVGGNGGAISLIAGQNINIDGSISSASKSLSFLVNANVVGGDGGDISLVAEQGININGYIDSSSEWMMFGGNTATGGNGGDISLVAKQKSINVEGSINSSSLTYAALSFSASRNSGSIGGDGGSVSLVAHRDIRLNSIDSFSLTTSETFLDEGTAVGGNGGAISLKAKTGSISVFAQVDQFSGELSNPSFQTFSVTNQSFFIAGGEAGNGGNVILEAATQIGAENVRFPVEILTLSSSAQSGTVQITGLGETFDLLNTVVITSKTIEIENPRVPSLPIRIPVGEVGQSGNIDISGNGNLTFTNSFFLSNTNGSDPAGNVTIRTPGSITFNNSSIETNTQSTGTAGDIDIRAASLTLDSRSQITAVTRSSGRAGNIRLRPYGNGQTLSINLNGEDSLISSSSLLPEAPDENANVIIDGIDGTDADLVSDGTYTYIVFDDVYIVLDSEDIIFDSLNSNEDANVIIDGIDGIDADLVSDGTHTYIVFDDVYIVLGDEGIIFNSSNFNGSEVTGNSGNIFISAPAAVTIQGEGDLKVETETSGNAGRLAINAPQVIVDGVEVSASSELPDLLTDELSEDAISQVRANYQSGQGGSIEINTRELILRDRAEITADTSTRGRGGNLIVQNSRGPLTMRGDGQLTVSASGDNSGRAGTLVINASGLLSLLDGIELAASSESINGGGEIDITVDGSLFMAGDSVINASASNPNAGDGGNININLIDGLLIAPPGQNNDIIANAAGGNGGKITITALGIYGFTLQDISDVEVLRSNSTNDISASSDAGIDGEITLNTFELDLNQLSELPANLVDVSGLAEQSLCEAGRGSEFVVTGRGGLPSSPNDALNSTATWEDWSVDMSEPRVDETPSELSNESLEEQPGTIVSEPAIVEAQGWIRAEDGRVALVADAATVVPDADRPAVQDCRQLRHVVSNGNLSL